MTFISISWRFSNWFRREWVAQRIDVRFWEDIWVYLGVAHHLRCCLHTQCLSLAFAPPPNVDCTFFCSRVFEHIATASQLVQDYHQRRWE